MHSANQCDFPNGFNGDDANSQMKFVNTKNCKNDVGKTNLVTNVLSFSFTLTHV